MTSKPRLFGTDGVRGTAGQFPLDRETISRLGPALGAVLARSSGPQPARILLGEDTRESSPWISRTLAAGLRSSGAEVVYAGVIPTPGVAFLIRHHGFAAGIMVSASHNPYQDNGIKVFTRDGTKLPDALELEVERELSGIRPQPGDERDLSPDARLLDNYVDNLVRLVAHGQRLSHFRLVVDCAHGAASGVIPRLLERLEIRAQVLNAEPSGQNINLDCGSMHPQAMAQATAASGADVGVAFDGDADRAIFATSAGRIADGDHVLYAMAPCFKRLGVLKGDAVVGTLMTNLGLELALRHEGIALKRTQVGDKYVLEEMLRSGINLGGEPSGHIIFADISLAGDGMITLLEVLRLLAETGKTLDELVGGLVQFPQVIHNVRVGERRPLESIPAIAAAIETCRREFGERGRVVIRYSGTEPVVRVMVEGEDGGAVEQQAREISDVIRSELG